MSENQRYQICARTETGHYSVTVDEVTAGRIYRRHGSWYADMPGHRIEKRFPDRYAAAVHLVEMTDAGLCPTVPAQELITVVAPHEAMRRAVESQRAVRTYGHLIPDLRPTLANLVRAAEAMARLAQLGWEPLAGYPGADQPWLMECRLPGCEWQGHRFWSKLRGRNGDNIPRPATRHPGCLPIEEHAPALITLAAERTRTCRCEFRHPATIAEALDLLKSLESRLNAGGDMVTAALLSRGILEPCTATARRARVLRRALDRLSAPTPFEDIPLGDCLLDHGHRDCVCDSCDEKRAQSLPGVTSANFQGDVILIQREGGRA